MGGLIDDPPRVRPVESRRDRGAYVSLLRKPYADQPGWVHPDARVLRNLLRGRSLLASRSEWRAFLAEEEGEPVACLTAFLHRSFEEKHQKKIATFGFFEALPDHDLAVARLFADAEAWARERGATRIWGPMNGHIMYGFGCLENRYDETPVVGTAYNRLEYPGHWWRHDFKKAPSFHSYRIDLEKPELAESLRAAIENPRLASDPAITIRPADLASWRREVEIFIDLHNRAFEKNWGDTPLSADEAWELMGLARLTTDPGLFLIAEMRGRPVGLVLCMADLNQVFRRTRAEPASLAGALALLRWRRSIKRGALHVIGVLEEARGRGLAETLAARAIRRMIERGWKEMEYCLVLEDNVASQRIARRFGGEQTKHYLMFEKVLR